MDLKTLDQSRFLRGDNLPPGGLVATIGGFALEQFDEGSKLVITWANPGLKPMLCNKTNRQRLMAMMGTSDTQQMIGRQVWVYYDQFVEYAGKMVGGLRLKEAPTPPQAAQEPAQAPITAAPAPTPAPAQRGPQKLPPDPAVADALARVEQRRQAQAPAPADDDGWQVPF